MTRINVVPPEELTDMHLLAEYRELPRVFALAKKFHASGKSEDFPSEYRLGNGHVKFFYNKLLWLYNRQHSLVHEMQKRGMSPQFIPNESLIEDMPIAYLNDYSITMSALVLNRERIALRLMEYQLKMSKKSK